MNIQPFCVYVTFYRGNKLPPFYIGYVRSHRVLVENYHGSVSSKEYKLIYEQELIDNPHLFITHIISFHATKQEANNREEFLQRSLNVHKNPLYMNKTVAAKNFVGCPIGHKRSLQTRSKMSKTWKAKLLSIDRTGANNPNFQKNWNDHQRKIASIKHIQRTHRHDYVSPTLGLKRLDLSLRNKSTKGTIWVNNGQISKQIKLDKLPEFLSIGFMKGMAPKH